MPRYTEQVHSIVNDATLTENVELAASGIIFTNTDQGRVLGRFIFSAGGSRLVNLEGGYIGAPVGEDPFVFEAVIGSSGNYTIIDSGNIQGLVRLGDGDDVLISNGAASTYATTVFGAELGAGDDLLRFEGSVAPSGLHGDGGDGIDTIEFAATTRQAWGDNLIGFEILSLRAGGNFSGFSGFTQVIGAPGLVGDVYNLINSDNPLADLALGGSLWILQSSDFRSAAGGDGDDGLWLGGSTTIAQGIAMGGGNDGVQLENGVRAVDVAPSIDGGAGDVDVLAYFLTQGAFFADSLSNVTGFERLRLINGASGSRQGVSLSNVSGFVDLYAESAIDLALNSGNLASTTVGGALGGSVSIGSNATIAAYRYGVSGFPLDTALTQANILHYTSLYNEGTVLGEVVFFDGDDFYDGTRGSAGFVHGNAGNDVLVGGSGADDLRGDAGADMLYGNGGNDILSGGSGRDSLFGGNGQDILSGGGDADILMAAALTT